MRYPSRLAGAVLLALVLLPWYRLVAARATGPSVDQTLHLGREYLAAHWGGLVLGAVLAIVLSRLVPPATGSGVRCGAERWLLRPSRRWSGTALGLLAAGTSLWLSVSVLNRRPALIDGVVQLLQARYFASGMLGGPPLSHPEFWQFQFMVLTDVGWVSQYPPGFPAALAVASMVGPAWLLGPILLGMAVYLTTQIGDRLFPGDRATARLGGALMAVSPFLAFHAGAYMSHVLALVLVSVALFASLRALDGSWRWALLSGAAVGGLVATRPYVGLTLGFVATVLVWWCVPGPRKLARGDWARRLGAAATGAAPFAVALMAYNTRVFGGPARFGYLAAAGPAHGLGFHIDPWGNPYGLREAWGYTAADLLGLSFELLQTPLPAVVLVGLYLLRTPRVETGGRETGTRLLVAWAMVPLAANALYWHHDLFMGPRFLYEAAPAWCLLLAVASMGLLRGLPEKGAGTGLSRTFTRDGVSAVFLVALAFGLTYAVPAKLSSYEATVRRSGISLRAPTVERPSLVFVHDSWESRLGARLSTLGMRLDSIRAALSHNSTCEVDLFVRAWEGDAGSGRSANAPPSGLSFARSSDRPLRDLHMPSGARIRTYDGETLESECERQAASDYSGIVALPPLLWQGDLPGLGSTGAMFVRDFGPARNARLLARYPDREPAVLVLAGTERLELVGYETGMEALWANP